MVSGPVQFAAGFAVAVLVGLLLLVIVLRVTSKNKPVSDIVKHTSEHEPGDQPGKI